MISLYIYIITGFILYLWIRLTFNLCNRINIKDCKKIKINCIKCGGKYNNIILVLALTFMTFRSYILLRMSNRECFNLPTFASIYNSKAIDLLINTWNFLQGMVTEIQLKGCTPLTFVLSIISVFVFLYIIKYENNYANTKRTIFILSICLCACLVVLPNRFLIVLLSCFIQSTVLTIFCSWLLSKMIQLIDTL